MNKILTLVILVITTYSFAQKQPVYYDVYQPVKRSTIGFNLGPTAFHGDADGTMLGLFGGLTYKYSFSPSLGICVSGSLGVLKGSRDKDKLSLSAFGNSWDKQGLGDEYTFKNKFWDVDITSHLVIGNLSYVRKPKQSHFYLLAGVGLMGNNVTGDVKGVMARDAFKYSKDSTYTYKGKNSKIPIGFGMSKKLTDKLDLGLEYKYNLTKKDLIDGYSFGIWNNRSFDSYSTLGIVLNYKLGKTDKKEHMDWISPTNAMIEDKSQEVNDTDGDGVADKFDAEPGTPKGAKVYGNGVAVDSDQDGVPDYKDDEVLSTCNKVDNKGVAFDADGDGVPDCRDEQSETPAGSLVDKNGKKVEISAPSNAGSCCDCNDVTLPSVFVDEDNEFRPEAYSALYLIGTKLQQCPDVSIDIIGYYGMNKSSEAGARAKTNLVIEYLVTNFGISRTKFNVQTKPETMGGKYSKQRVDINSKK